MPILPKLDADDAIEEFVEKMNGIVSTLSDALRRAAGRAKSSERQAPVAVAMVAAFPPPICGQSLAADLLRQGLKDDDEFVVFEFDIARQIAGDPTLIRVFQLCRQATSLAWLCVSHRRLVVYLQLGHGAKALCRDLVFMTIASATRHACVAHVHGSGLRKALDGMPMPLRRLETHALKKLHTAIVLSPHLRRMFEGILDENRIVAIDNGIDPNFIKRCADEMPRPDRKTLRILFLSNFLAEKGLFTLLDAAKMAQEAAKDYEFILVGAPPKTPNEPENAAQAYIRSHGIENASVYPIATGEQKHAHYRNADIFILPSRYEGQPLCILEALFEGLPVITTRVGGIPDIFGSSQCVRYVDVDDPAGIVRAIDSLASKSLRDSLAHVAHDIAWQRFTPEKHVDAVKEILKKAHSKR